MPLYIIHILCILFSGLFLNLEEHFLFCDLRDEEENVINMDRMAFSGDFLTQSHVPFATLAEGYDENKDIIRLYAYKNERFFPIESIRDFFAKYSYILPSPMDFSPVKIPELLVTVERKLKSVDKPIIIMTSWNQAIYKAVRLNHESDFITALQLFNESINPDKMGSNYIDISDNSDEEGCNLGEKYFLHHVKSLPLKDSVSDLNLQAFCLITVFEAQNVNVELVFHTEVNCRDIKILKCRTSDKVMKIKDRYLKFFGEKFHSKEQQSHMYLLQDGVRVPSDFCIHTYCNRPNAASTITFDVDICEEDPIEILVKIKRSTKALLIHDNMTVLGIKHKICTYFGIPVETQRLSFNKRELSDQKYISCYALRERDVINLEQMKKVDVHFDFKKHKYDPLTIRLYRGMRVNDVKSELAKRYDMLECWIDLYHQGTKMVKATLYDNGVQHLSQIDVYFF